MNIYIRCTLTILSIGSLIVYADNALDEQSADISSVQCSLAATKAVSAKARTTKAALCCVEKALEELTTTVTRQGHTIESRLADIEDKLDFVLALLEYRDDNQ
jgi:hypothetical protein